ncbi:MarR family transcriptional regulator [Niallia oryzisoli]|uniref:MarR family transcriptional regulator n=1 Tax=Niallia oryzisoli TaxID=1737571 RepID=A0ABZ2C9F6_9BACI
METNEQELLEEADMLFRKMVRKFVKERDKIKIEGVMLPSFVILEKIMKDGEQRLTDLAEELDFTSGAITALCDKLEKRGLAVRKRHKKDRRIVWLDITGDGRDFINRNYYLKMNSISVLFNGFSQEEMKEQINGYRRLITNIERFSTTINEIANENECKKKI